VSSPSIDGQKQACVYAAALKGEEINLDQNRAYTAANTSFFTDLVSDPATEQVLSVSPFQISYPITYKHSMHVTCPPPPPYFIQSSRRSTPVSTSSSVTADPVDHPPGPAPSPDPLSTSPFLTPRTRKYNAILNMRGACSVWQFVVSFLEV